MCRDSALVTLSAEAAAVHPAGPAVRRDDARPTAIAFHDRHEKPPASATLCVLGSGAPRDHAPVGIVCVGTQPAAAAVAQEQERLPERCRVPPARGRCRRLDGRRFRSRIRARSRCSRPQRIDEGIARVRRRHVERRGGRGGIRPAPGPPSAPSTNAASSRARAALHRRRRCRRAGSCSGRPARTAGRSPSAMAVTSISFSAATARPPGRCARCPSGPLCRADRDLPKDVDVARGSPGSPASFASRPAPSIASTTAATRVSKPEGKRSGRNWAKSDTDQPGSTAASRPSTLRQAQPPIRRQGTRPGATGGGAAARSDTHREERGLPRTGQR